MALEIANTILAQLGGGRFLMMTGSKDLVGGERTLSMRLGRGTKNKATHMRVTLDATDTYTVDFMKWNRAKLEMQAVSSESMIYDDMLQSTFTSATGFYTSL